MDSAFGVEHGGISKRLTGMALAATKGPAKQGKHSVEALKKVPGGWAQSRPSAPGRGYVGRHRAK